MIKLLKIVSIFLIFSFSLLVSIPLFSQSKPLVQVDPVINLSDEVWLDAVCDAATDNVLFTLKILGQFEVMSDSISENGTEKLIDAEVIDQDNFDTSSLKTRAESKGYDNILFGSCTIEDGSYVIKINAYDLALDKITYSGSTVVESIFDTFEAVDEITYLTVEGFSGIHVTYGSLLLVPPDTGEPFGFTIDGIALPEGIFSVERMPAGVHELAVRQERPFGLYEAVHEINVEEEKANRIDIPIPNIAGAEIPLFTRIDKVLRITSIKGHRDIAPLMDDLNSLLNTPFYQEYRSAIVEKYERWRNLFGLEIVQKDESEKERREYLNRSIWESEKVRGINNFDVSLTAQFDILLKNKAQLETDNIIVPEFKTISIDGNMDDWADVSSVVKDKIGDFLDVFDLDNGHDIAWIGVAMDDRNCYFSMKIADSVYRKDCWYQLDLKDIDRIHFSYDGSAGNFSIASMPERNNEKAKWFSSGEIGYQARKGDILEVTIPLDLLAKWLETENGIVDLRGSIEYFPKREFTDSISMQFVHPSIYNAFRVKNP